MLHTCYSNQYNFFLDKFLNCFNRVNFRNPLLFLSHHNSLLPKTTNQSSCPAPTNLKAKFLFIFYLSIYLSQSVHIYLSIYPFYHYIYSLYPYVYIIFILIYTPFILIYTPFIRIYILFIIIYTPFILIHTLYPYIYPLYPYIYSLYTYLYSLYFHCCVFKTDTVRQSVIWVERNSQHIR